MKKFIFISIFVFITKLGIYAQCKPDTTIITPGIYPKNLPEAREDSLYDEAVQFKMPKDTQSFVGLVKFGDVKVYPIPFDQTLNINISSKQSVKGLIEIFSISGKRVFLKTIQLNSGFNHVNLETSTLQKGIYILKLNSDEGELCYKLIK